jgi:hypothetical protein
MYMGNEVGGCWLRLGEVTGKTGTDTIYSKEYVFRQEILEL